MMNFKGMWAENKRMINDRKEFDKNYRVETSVVTFGLIVVTYGVLLAIDKIDKVRARRVYEKLQNCNKEES